MQDEQIAILIVGAGPTGLMMACELVKHHIPFRIIDKNDEKTASSNATWIQTLTLELLDHLGILDRFLRLGNACDAINLYYHGKSISQISLSYIESIYKFILMLPQSETERLLIGYLNEQGITIERAKELIDISQEKDGTVKSTIKSKGAKNEIVSSRFVIACDGANSTIRKKCKMIFPGEDLQEQFVVADATIDSYMSKKEIHFFFGKGEVFAAFPMHDHNVYRISANLNLPVVRKHYFEKEIIEMAQERAFGAYYVKAVSWISTFWIHGKVINKMNHGSIFFAGDAAHLHSPALGQGMNTGLQDVNNLAWKLALVIKGKAKPSLLNSYHQERYPIIKAIVKKNNYYTKLAIGKKNFANQLHQLNNKIKKSKEKISKQIGMELTQLDIKYQKSAIIAHAHSKTKSLKPGQHAPNVMIDDAAKLYDYLHNMNHNILLFTGKNLTPQQLKKIVALREKIQQHYPELAIYIITLNALNQTNIIFDNKGNIHQRYNIAKPCVYILRPDNYIGYFSTKFDFTSLNHFLKKYFI